MRWGFAGAAPASAGGAAADAAGAAALLVDDQAHLAGVELVALDPRELELARLAIEADDDPATHP
ncbi:MAG TPA: hypothetical protein VGK67_07705 [Myxococcales bacterium]